MQGFSLAYNAYRGREPSWLNQPQTFQEPQAQRNVGHDRTRWEDHDWQPSYGKDGSFEGYVCSCGARLGLPPTTPATPVGYGYPPTHDEIVNAMQRGISQQAYGQYIQPSLNPKMMVYRMVFEKNGRRIIMEEEYFY